MGIMKGNEEHTHDCFCLESSNEDKKDGLRKNLNVHLSTFFLYHSQHPIIKPNQVRLLTVLLRVTEHVGEGM